VSASLPAGSSRLRETLRAITWRHVVVTAVIGLLLEFVLMTTSRAIFMFWKDNGDQRIFMLKQVFGQSQLAAFVFLFCLVGADQAVRRGASRGIAYGTALVVASCVSTAVDWSVHWYVLDWFSQPYIQPWFKKAAPMMSLMNTAMFGGLATLVYVDWQQARASAERLHAATVARTEAGREILLAQLQAMQARVDPQWLFDMLDRVKRFSDTDPAQGDRTLDDLIVYLRTAMPQLRGRSSNLAGEVELARTFVVIVNDCSVHKMHFECDLASAPGAAAIPPMVLLPIVRCALTHSGSVAVERNAITIDARDNDGRLQVTVSHGGGVFTGLSADAALAPVRERLHAYFQGDASFEARGLSDGTSEVVMGMPYERA
jgi:hypothetical protein